jgi:hypothetical protein
VPGIVDRDAPFVLGVIVQVLHTGIPVSMSLAL